ncbi:MAG: NAD-dependent epimerase/dehydratase family protein [Methanobacteriota archaeon]|nr:MAG: NAD-dependent epimerase/dehydratase family protein [Euryarchaeota archaeon]
MLAIGGTGFIGRYVVGYLANSGHDVAVFHRGTKETTLPSSVRHLHGDRERLAHFQNEFRDFAPDCVLAMALPAGNDRTGRLFVDVFRGIARRTVVITSRDVYRAFGRLRRLETGMPDPVPLTETSPLREKLYPYRGAAADPMWANSDDLLVERAVMSEPQFQATVIRLPVIYGPQDEHFHRTFPYLKRMDDGRRAILLDEAHASWRDSRVYVEDAAWAIVLAATDDRAAGRIYNVAPTQTLTEAEWVESIGNVAGWSGDIVRIPRDRLPKHLVRDLDFRHDLALSSQRIRDDLGYSERISFDRGLKKTVEWERSNPPEIQRGLFDYEAEDLALRGPAL